MTRPSAKPGAMTLATRNAAIIALMPLAHMLASKSSRRTGCPLDDATQDALLGLVRASYEFDSARGLQFSTLAYTFILNQLRNSTMARVARNCASRPRGEPFRRDTTEVSLETPLADDSSLTVADVVAAPDDVEGDLAAREVDAVVRRECARHGTSASDPGAARNRGLREALAAALEMVPVTPRQQKSDRAGRALTLTRLGLSAREIAERLGVSERQAVRYRSAARVAA